MQAATPEATLAATATAVQQLWRGAAAPWGPASLPLQQRGTQQHARGFAAEAGKRASGGKEVGGDDAAAAAAAESSSGGEGAGADEEQPTVEQLTAELQEREKAVEELQTKVRGQGRSGGRCLDCARGRL
jgi:hypothetical protein